MTNAQTLPGQGERIPEFTKFDRLAKARTSSGLEQSELAAMTGISRATISAVENGHREPSRSTTNLWALATGVPVVWIETGYTPRDLNPEPTVFRKIRNLHFQPANYIGLEQTEAA